MQFLLSSWVVTGDDLLMMRQDDHFDCGGLAGIHHELDDGATMADDEMTTPWHLDTIVKHVN